MIEFLDYTADEVKLQQHMQAGKKSFPTFSDSNVAPSVAGDVQSRFVGCNRWLSGNMHVSFNIREDQDLTEFIPALEAAAHSRGYSNVWCDRLVPVKSHEEYKTLPKSDNAYYVVDGNFQGWSLAYCKGPDGEQLEFNQVTSKAKAEFSQALAQYVTLGKNDLW